MEDYIKALPKHVEAHIGENNLYLEVFEGSMDNEAARRKPPLLFVHGAYTGSWMWSKYIPHFIGRGYTCYAMNMRSHYKSRVMDMTLITYRDYLEDIRLVLAECNEPPVLIGFSMGGILCQKIAEDTTLAGFIAIDTSISKEVNRIAPFTALMEEPLGNVLPAPVREEESSLDESPNDIAFQRKYLSMESSLALGAVSCWIKGNEGVSVDGSRIVCPCFVVKAVNSSEDDRRGRATAEQLKADYFGVEGATHTGLLVGQRYFEVVEEMLQWLAQIA